MYKLGLYIDQIAMRYKRPTRLEESYDLSLLISKARIAVASGFYQGIILDDNDRIVKRIADGMEEYTYLNEEASQKLSGIMFQICQKLKIKNNKWYRLRSYGDYDSEIVLEEYCKGSENKVYRVAETFVKELISVFILNIRELTSLGVSCVVFNAREVNESVTMYISYTNEDINNCVRVEVRKRS